MFPKLLYSVLWQLRGEKLNTIVILKCFVLQQCLVAACDTWQRTTPGTSAVPHEPTVAMKSYPTLAAQMMMEIPFILEYLMASGGSNSPKS